MLSESGVRKIQKSMKERGLTPDALGEAVGITGRSIRRIIAGEQIPTMRRLGAICAVLEIEPKSVIGNQQNVPDPLALRRAT